MTLRMDNPTIDPYYANSPLRAENEALFDKCHRIGYKGGKILKALPVMAKENVEDAKRRAAEIQHELHSINLEAMKRIKPLLGSSALKRCEGTILYLERQVKGSK